MEDDALPVRPATPLIETRQPPRHDPPGAGRLRIATIRLLLGAWLVGALPPMPDALTQPIPAAWTGPAAPAHAKDEDFVSGTDGGGGERPSSTRSIFLSLFATHFIPGIAEGLSDWFGRRLFGGEADASAGSGSESNTSTSTSEVAEVAETPMRARAAAPAAAAGPTLHAGIAYEVLLLGSNGERNSVDAQKHIFRSGERFEVTYRPNFPGRVDVYNIDPVGRVTLIDRLTLQAAELGTLGPYEFVGDKGEDLLRIVLHPCRAPATTRSIRRIEMRKEVDRVLGDCAEVERSQNKQVATRSIAKVAREGGTAYALDPVQKSELDSGRLQPREIIIRFRHE